MSEYSQNQVSKTVKLNLNNVDIRDWETVKQEVGEFVVDSILDRVAEGKTPVHRQRDFRKLDPDYASEFKRGDRTANLDLRGDMLDSLQFRSLPNDEIEIGIFDPNQAPKAFGHNTGFEGGAAQSRDLVRRFIPRESQRFNDEIQGGIKDIVSRFETVEEEIQEDNLTDFLFEAAAADQLTRNLLSDTDVNTTLLLQEILNGEG